MTDPIQPAYSTPQNDKIVLTDANITPGKTPVVTMYFKCPVCNYDSIYPGAPECAQCKRSVVFDSNFMIEYSNLFKTIESILQK